MNRQQRRQLDRNMKNDQAVLTLKRADAKQVVDEIVNEKLKEIQSEAVQQTLSLMCLELNARHGFGAKMLKQTLLGISNQFECVKGGYLTKKDVESELKKLKLEIR